MIPIRSLGGLSLLVLAACGREVPPRPGLGGPVAETPAYRLAAGTAAFRYDAVGSVRAARRAELATRLMGTVQTVRVRAGDRVAAGQTLLTIDAGSPDAGLAQARAGLDLATRTLRRMERLYADSAVPAAQLDAARAAHAQAEAQAGAAAVEVGYAGIKAPFSGVVAARMADPGDLAAPGQPLLVIEDTDAMEIVIGVPEELVAAVKPGLRFPVRLGSAERRVEARVTTVVPVTDPGSRTVEVRLAAPAGTTSGTSAIAEIPLAPGTGLRVRSESLVRRGQLTGVFLLTPDSTARLRWVRVGRADAAGVEVLSGLAEGDIVALRPDSLRDGGRARPRFEGSRP